MKSAVTAWKFNAAGLGVELAEQAVIAETMGFDSFWLPENHFTGPAAIPSPLMLLAAVSSRTTRIRLGSTSYLLPIRNPILAAEEVSVLDQLSNGRVILGIGRGFQDAMFQIFDIPTKQKRMIFRENLTAMISAWRGSASYSAPLDVHRKTRLSTRTSRCCPASGPSTSTVRSYLRSSVSCSHFNWFGCPTTTKSPPCM